MSQGVSFEGNTGPVTVINEARNPRASVLGRLIEIIAAGDCESINLDRIPAEIEHKISFNSLSKFQWVVALYVGSSLLVDKSILELNQTILNGGMKLKRQMKIFYLSALSKYAVSTSPFDLDRLRCSADSIVGEVIDLTTNLVRNSSDLGVGYFDEDIQYGVALIVSYSIIECVVLENPNDHR